MTLDGLNEGIVGAASSNAGMVALGGAGGLIIGGLAGAAIGAKAKRRKNKRRSSKSSRRRNSNSRSKKRTKYARTAGKRKDRSSRRIRMTKTGQPYIILANGRARFIKKSSARRSRKMKGGKY